MSAGLSVVDGKRVRRLKTGPERRGPVVYWMSRDQRVRDNWALLFAQALALEKKSPLAVVFNLAPAFLEATVRHYGFMLRGLAEAERALADLSIPFVLLRGEPAGTIPVFLKQIDAAALVTDFDPLRVKRRWKREVGERITLPFYGVDAHNIVPCFFVSGKQEFAARTIRPKISRLLRSFLTDFPAPKKMPRSSIGLAADGADWKSVLGSFETDRSVPETRFFEPGAKAAAAALRRFIRERLADYDEARNDPVADGQSGLSPYLHFGQISAQRVALEVRKARAPLASKKAFLEELIVRRELADNYCFYNDDYDSFAGFPDWAKRTLERHRRDPREYLYSRRELEAGRTHDSLWNAAQLEMVRTGKMHGFMRMYWAKKILEWSETPEDAMAAAVYLNDRYELDGRDPNGYTGCAWSIGGVHDRPWFERPVYGQVRYMSAAGAARKFDVGAYIEKVMARVR
jgi:deoxyribodipyrimidine photo-lyase